MSVLIALALAVQTAMADQIDPRYQDCVSLIDADMEIGRIAAQQWAAEGGGAIAQHCLALADLAAGFPKLAAARFQEIAGRSDAGDAGIRAKILAQAANAWLEAGLPQNAGDAIDEAFLLTPDAGELNLVAAKVYEAQERPLDVIKAVSAAQSAGLGSAAGFVSRGRAYFQTGDTEAAANDVVNALQIDPYNLDALVLRGELQQTGIVIEVHYGGEP